MRRVAITMVGTMLLAACGVAEDRPVTSAVPTSSADEKPILGCAEFDASVLDEHNNFVASEDALTIDSATRVFILRADDPDCLDNPAAVELMRNEGVRVDD